MGNPGDPRRAMAVRVDEQGVVRLRWASGVRITADLATAAMALVDGVNDGRCRPLLVEMAGAAGVTREARTTFAQPCTVRRLALLGRSPVDRVHANSTLGASRPQMPTRFFTSEEDALNWLRVSASAPPIQLDDHDP